MQCVATSTGTTKPFYGKDPVKRERKSQQVPSKIRNELNPVDFESVKGKRKISLPLIQYSNQDHRNDHSFLLKVDGQVLDRCTKHLPTARLSSHK